MALDESDIDEAYIKPRRRAVLVNGTHLSQAERLTPLA